MEQTPQTVWRALYLLLPCVSLLATLLCTFSNGMKCSKRFSVSRLNMARHYFSSTKRELHWLIKVFRVSSSTVSNTKRKRRAPNNNILIMHCLSRELGWFIILFSPCDINPPIRPGRIWENMGPVRNQKIGPRILDILIGSVIHMNLISTSICTSIFRRNIWLFCLNLPKVPFMKKYLNLISPWILLFCIFFISGVHDCARKTLKKKELRNQYHVVKTYHYEPISCSKRTKEPKNIPFLKICIVALSSELLARNLALVMLVFS